jgi:hypothetical protein
MQSELGRAFSRALVREDAAERLNGGRARSRTTSFASRRGESLGTDSRVLRLVEAVDAPFPALRCKIFWRCGFRRVDVFALAIVLRPEREARLCATTKHAARYCRSPRFIGIFVLRRNSLPTLAPPRIFFCCALVDDRATRGAVLRSGAVTHKIKQSHCYFFPAVVIGCQCWSIRDRTAPMSPSTQARRAAMAKKRKTKKKGAKKKKKK